MKHLGLFAGIGGFELAAKWMGWETVAWCEWSEFAQKMLKYHFPEAEGHLDITKTDFTKYANKIDIVTGGFPCQPYSTAGKRKGKDDERHLWPQMLRAIQEIQPRWVVGENVRGLVSWNRGMVFDEVQTDLETQGYEVLPFILPSCGVNAPHRRDMVWFIAHATVNYDRGAEREFYKENGRPDRQMFSPFGGAGHCIGKQRDASDPQRFGRFQKQQGATPAITNQFNTNANTNTQGPRLERIFKTRRWGNGPSNTYTGNHWQQFPTQPAVCGGNDGISRKLDGITFPNWRRKSIESYGNAVVPPLVFEIFKAIEAFENIKY